MTVNPAIVAAVCGFLFRELLAVEARADKSTPFQLGYYLRHNWVAVALNAVGTVGLWVALPELLTIQGNYIGAEYPILTGLVVGLLGAWLVRKLQDLVKNRVNISVRGNGQ
jgi:hypothetical protein